MAVQSLAESVPYDVRSRGAAYFQMGRVTILAHEPNGVAASVHGSKKYTVNLQAESGRLDGWCSCPYYQDSFSPCKHVWATILAADSANCLPKDVHTLASTGEDDDIFADDFVPRPRQRASQKPKRGRKPRTPSWEKQLAGLAPRQQGYYYETPWPANREVVYVIDVPESARNGILVMDVSGRELKRNGDWSKPLKSLSIVRHQVRTLNDPLDREVLCILFGAEEEYADDYRTLRRCKVQPDLAVTLLPRLCATGRCFVRRGEDYGDIEPLQWSNTPWELVVNIHRHAAGKHFEIAGFLQAANERVPLDAALLTVRGACIINNHLARLDDHGAFSWLQVLRNAAGVRVPVGEADKLLKQIFASPKLPRLELPDELNVEIVQEAPTPRLKVSPPQHKQYYGKEWLEGKLTFSYGGVVIDEHDKNDTVLLASERRVIQRDRRAEIRAGVRLDQLGCRSKNSTYSYSIQPRQLAPRNLAGLVRALLAEGWQVEAEGKLYRKPGNFQIEVRSGIDWFELHGDVKFDEQTASLPALLAALKRGDNTVLLDDGTFGLLPEEWLKKYGMLAGLGSDQEDHLRFEKCQVGLLDALLASQPEFNCDAVFQHARDELKRFAGIEPADAPPDFIGELRGYQREGLGWLEFLRRFSFGGCLADDMGLGKTVQVLAMLERLRVERGDNGSNRAAASLVVVPRSLVFNWKQEAARFTPKLRVLDHTGVGRLPPGEHFAEYDIVLATYGTLRRDALSFKDIEFNYVILDESQAIKNAGSESAKAARLLSGRHRLAMSGTPIENNLGELWSLFEFLNPGMLGAASVFRLGGAGRDADPESRQLLASALRPFILRRTKEQVAKDLPEKLEQTLYCDLDVEQRKHYDQLRDHFRASLLQRIDRDGLNKSKIQVLEALLRLRQAACHPGLIDKKMTAQPSAKLDVLLSQLDSVLQEGHKALVFSQFTSMLAIVRQRLDEQQITYEYLDGRTRNRAEKVARFQEDADCKLFLISLKAGGVGLNLTAADYVFLLDPWWNPAVEAQAIDRTHRIGQSRRVFAYRLIARDTVEEKVLQLQESKRELADAIINADNSLIRSLGREDIELLLS